MCDFVVVIPPTPTEPPSLRVENQGRPLSKLEIPPNPTSAVINHKGGRQRDGRCWKLKSPEGGGALIFPCQPVCLHPWPETPGCHGDCGRQQQQPQHANPTAPAQPAVYGKDTSHT